MKRHLFALVALSLVAGAAAAQTPTDSTPPPPRPASSQPAVYRWGGLSGAWTMPQGDFKNAAGDGWGILIMGEQFINPTMMVAVTSDVGYLDFGSKSIGSTKYDVNMFPVQAGIRVYPTAQKNPDSRAKLFGQGGLGFYTTRSEVSTGAIGSTSQYDYYFGATAGGGVKLMTGGAAALLFDATWNWVFGGNPDPNFLALRGAIMVPVGR